MASASQSLFVEISEAGKRIALMEELHGTDSPQHQKAVCDREDLIERWRLAKHMEARSDAKPI